MFGIIGTLGVLLNASLALENETDLFVKQGLSILPNQFVSFEQPCNDQVLTTLSTYSHLQSITFHISPNAPMPLHNLATLQKLPYLTKLVLPGMTITEKDGIILSKFLNLTYLDLSFCSIETKALCHIATLPLTTLSLNNTKLSDKDVAYLRKLRSSLKELFLNNNGITSKSGPTLSQFTHLITLSLSRNYFSDHGLQYLSALTSLETLSLHDSLMTDEATKFLINFPRLKSLTLSNNFLTDDCIPSLKKLPKLEFLDLQTNPQITSEAITDILFNNKNMRILHDHTESVDEEDLVKEFRKL